MKLDMPKFYFSLLIYALLQPVEDPLPVASHNQCYGVGNTNRLGWGCEARSKDQLLAVDCRDCLATALPIDVDLTRVFAVHIVNPVHLLAQSGWLANLPHLESLSLRFLLADPVEPAIIDGVENITELSLGYRWSSPVPKPLLKRLRNLRRLSFSSHSIGLKAGDFACLKRLEQLVIEPDTISYIEDGVFRGLTNLRLLDLSGNQLKTLSKGVVIDLPKWRAWKLKLIMANNSWHCTSRLRAARQYIKKHSTREFIETLTCVTPLRLKGKNWVTELIDRRLCERPWTCRFAATMVFLWVAAFFVPHRWWAIVGRFLGLVDED